MPLTRASSSGHGLSATAESVWAKTGETDTEWMPLYQHMRDTAAVGGWLWDNWLPTATRALLTGNLHQHLARQRFVWLCAAHDIGKATPPFAASSAAGRTRMETAGMVFTTVPARDEMWHSIGSHLLLHRWMTDHGWGIETADSYAVVPGSHHGTTPDFDELEHADDRPRLTGTDASWARAQVELIDFTADVAGLTESDIDALGRSPLSAQQQAVSTGLLIMADWLASDTDRFPLDGHGPERAARGISTLNLPAPWAPKPDDSTVDEFYAARFGAGFTPRPVQRDGLDVARAMKSPGLVIVEAPMGEGKTELGFAVAETLAAKFGFGGIFTALPTMATSNAMFSRFSAYIETVSAGPASLHLAHSKRELNEDFMNLHRTARIGNVGDVGGGSLTAHEWLQGSGKLGVLSSFVVGTIDQVLVGALQSKHLMLRHLALANKVVLIDEVHAVDTYMSVYLDRALRWLGSYNIPVVLMSATLPEDRRIAMLEAYKPGSATGMTGTAGYPLITAVTADGVISKASDRSGRTSHVRIIPMSAHVDPIVAQLQRSLAGGGVAAVIRNTVASAQETARAIRLAMPDCEVILAHARFVDLDRAAIDANLVERLGEHSTTRPKKAVVVGTQVLEQSLDIDFDVMITDLAPVDLVLQRIGRLHRHPRAHRPPALTTPVCFIAGLPEDNSVEKMDRSSVYIYSARPLLRSAITLNKALPSGITLPEDIPTLVADAYSPVIPGDETVDAYEAEWAELIREKAAKARGFLLGLPGHSIIDWMQRSVGDAEDERNAGSRQVRDIQDTLEVVVLQRQADGTVRTLPHLRADSRGHARASLVVTTDTTPALAVRRVIKQSSVRMPPALSHKSTLDALTAAAPKSWLSDRSPMRYLVPLTLDEHLTVKVDGKKLTYSPEEGLVQL
jgi:CRISPR-associated endonuclease/helicase Cas3